MGKQSHSSALTSDMSNSPKKGRKPPVVPTPEKQAEFLSLLREGRTVEGAARNVGIHRSTLYRLRDRDEDFKRAWDEAWEAGIEALEDELRRRGFEGVEKPVFHGGVVVGSVREFDTTAAIFILKARKPEVYRDNARIEHTGPGGGPVQVESFREEFIRRIERLAARRGMVGIPAPGGPPAHLPPERESG
jgi:AcrR family transcriptional regulator